MSEDPQEPARAINLAMEEAGVGPTDIHYVNLHGTATPMNDRVETRALKIAYVATHAYKSTHVVAENRRSATAPREPAAQLAVAATLFAMEPRPAPTQHQISKCPTRSAIWTMFQTRTKGEDRQRPILQLRGIRIEELGSDPTKTHTRLERTNPNA